MAKAMAASLLTSALRLFRSSLHRLRLLTASLQWHDTKVLWGFSEGSICGNIKINEYEFVEGNNG